jgi:molybdenum cofactor cytidylyltransferase
MIQTPLQVCGIVLAAGQSRRMGTPKALLPAGGQTFLEQAIEVLREGGCCDVIVVVSHTGRRESAVALAGGARVVENADPESQPVDSLRLALRNLSGQPDAIAILPVDHALVGSATVAALLQAFRTHPGSIVRPVHAGVAGHPTLFDRAYIPEFLTEVLPEGARSVILRNSTRVIDVATEDEGVVVNLDSPADYERWFGRKP